MRGIRSVDRIVDLCERDLAFIWLTRGQKPKRDAFYDFKNRKLTSDVLDDLNYQFMRRLQKEGLVTLKELFIDGTKIEANANRYTFVWRGSINYHLAGLLDSIDQLFEKYNSFLQENDYGTKYELGNAQMFVIEGMDKVREVIEKTLDFLPEKEKKDTVKKTCQRVFQALRIDVNREFEVLYDFMEKLPGALKPGGRVAILTFHSGEDKLVKKALKQGYKEGIYSDYSKDVIRPSAQECAQNGRARSTKMRWAIKA